MGDHSKGLLITLAGVFLVVPDALFVRLIDAEPLVIAFWRALFSGLILLVWMALRHRGALPEKVVALGWRGLVYAGALGLSGTLFVLAVSMTSVANVVFIIAAMPIFAALLSWLLLGERPDRRMVVTIAVVIAGLGIIALGSDRDGTASLAGNLVALAVAAVFALALTVIRTLKDRSVLPMAPLAQLGTAGVLAFFVPLSLLAPGTMALILLHGVFIAGSTAFLSLGPRYLPSAEVALLILGESVLSPILVWLVIGENPGAGSIIGGAIVIGMLTISNLLVLRRARPPRPS